MTSKLINLQKKCEEYTKDQSYVYKSVFDIEEKKSHCMKWKWLVIMKKLDTTKTNEDRKAVVDANYAKFRANELQVIKIINITTPETERTQITNDFEGIKLMYKVGEIVKPNSYNDDINEICSNGIHYFKTLESAYYYENELSDFTGKWYSWFGNGQKELEIDRKNGIPDGKLIEWSENGQLNHKAYFEKGDRKGEWMKWCPSSEFLLENRTTKNNQEGKWIFGNDDGVIYETDYFKNGTNDGQTSERRKSVYLTYVLWAYKNGIINNSEKEKDAERLLYW